MFHSVSKAYLVLIQCTIFYQKYNYITALMGPNVRQVEENEFPAVVSLMRTKNFLRSEIERFHKCSGTLVSRQDVLTAEHCLITMLTEGFKIMIGSRDLLDTFAHDPLFIWTYEQWHLFRRGNTTGYDQDIAFVKLTANIPNNIPYALVGNIGNEHLYGMQVDTAGWGIRSNGTRVRILQTAKVRIMTHTECQRRYFELQHETVYVHKRFICSSGNPFAVLTDGDSGGPIFFFGTLIGTNKGVFPIEDGLVHQNLINLHMSLRYYYDYFQDIITTFHMNF